jgi:sugar phosphate isomerase/epimerase
MAEMPATTFILSVFGDEIAGDLRDQLDLMGELQVGYLEFRSAWGKNVLHMDGEEVARVKQLCDEHGVAVSCIGSPIGKSPIRAPIEEECANLTRIFRTAETLGARNVRMFSFYPPDTGSNEHYDAYLEEAISRLTRLTELARNDGFLLLLENEKDIVGDTIARCHALLSAIDDAHLRFIWDPANFVQVGEARVTERGWPLLSPFTAHVHVKDAVLSDGSVRAAGEGDGQVPELLSKLRDSGYRGFLALEPHLAIAGHSGGFTGVTGMTYAVARLRELMADLGIEESVSGLE